MGRGAYRLLLTVFVALSGCGRTDAPSPAAPAPDNFQANGIRYDLPIAGSGMDRANEFLRAVKSDGLSWEGGGHKLEVSGGKVTLDGRPHGTLQPGDRLRLTADGTLFVNDEKRQPEA